MSSVQTHYPISPQDDTVYLMVSNSEAQLRPNFKESELYNSRTGLPEHPIAEKIVDVVQFMRTQFEVPIHTTSSYRNYIPTSGINPATISPHMLAQALDFQFIADQATKDELYIQIRDDFDKKGPLFQALWEMGVRGFGSYDTFIHLDVVQSELYPAFSSKRKRKYQGKIYARWNSMKALRYRKAKGDNVITSAIKSAIGSVRGALAELENTEDQGDDISSRSLGYFFLLFLLGFSVIGAFLYVGRKKMIAFNQ